MIQVAILIHDPTLAQSRAAIIFDSVADALIPSMGSNDSHLRGPRRLAWPRTSPFHGGNTGSNPVGDANLINYLRNCWFWRATGYATVQLLNHSPMSVTLLFRHRFVVDIHRD